MENNTSKPKINYVSYVIYFLIGIALYQAIKYVMHW